MIPATDILKALSEPIRLRIMVLLTRGELCVCDLIEVLNLPQSTISRHVGRLRQAGLVQDRRNGKWVYYRLTVGDSMIESGVRQVIEGLTEDPVHRDDLSRLAKHRNTKQC